MSLQLRVQLRFFTGFPFNNKMNHSSATKLIILRCNLLKIILNNVAFWQAVKERLKRILIQTTWFYENNLILSVFKNFFRQFNCPHNQKYPGQNKRDTQPLPHI